MDEWRMVGRRDVDCGSDRRGSVGLAGRRYLEPVQEKIIAITMTKLL